MNQCLRSLSCLLSVAAVALFATGASARGSHQQQHAKKTTAANKKTTAAKPTEAKTAEAKKTQHRRAAAGKGRHGKQAAAQRKSKAIEGGAGREGSRPGADGRPCQVKEAIDLARKAKTEDATAARNAIADPAGQRLVEWFILRHSETTANFTRYAAFIATNPEWPSMALMRRRAEARLWQERSDAATVHAFTGDRPTTAKGKFALARVLLNEGDRDGAAKLVREAWRSEELSDRSEADAL